MGYRTTAMIFTALLFAAAPAAAQVPPTTTPPDKIDPGPVRPDNPAPPDNSGAPAPQAGGDPLNVPAQVFALRIAGTWEADGKRGFARVVGQIEDGRQRFYAQWLGEDGKVVATKEAVDDEAAKLTFGDVRAEPGQEGDVTVFLDTVPDKDGMRDTWVMVLGAPGDVRFGPSTN